MPDSSELLETADFLLNAAPRPPSDARLRRAASTAYYALFHFVARRAAVSFMASASSERGGWTLIYRNFDHRLMERACKSLAQPVLAPAVVKSLGRTTVSAGIREFASAFGPLQELRHLADYDPVSVFGQQDVEAIILNAADAIAAFDRTLPDEQADVLAFLMVRSRQ